MVTPREIAEKLKRVETCSACEIEGQQHTCMVRDVRWCGRELARQLAWVKCSVRMPAPFVDVLGYSDSLNATFIVQLAGDVWARRDRRGIIVNDDLELFQISHWQQLPDLPEAT